ncbi:MAG: hypothetical protein SFY67_18560 [Candidatus Melainabacteria bacterium]|nr:hypothetical protein [Candidatus Melainabacteria bacterium]
MKNNDNETALSKVTLEKPCSQNWDEMVGDERERFCNKCSLNVYNLSSMTRDEAEEFLQVRNDGSVCLNYTSDAEGKVITDNVPRSLRPLRDRLQPILRVVSSFVAAFGLFATSVFAQEQRLGGKPCVPTKNQNTQQQTVPMLGSPPVPSQAAQEAMNAEKVLKDKIKSLELKKKINTKLGATGILDLANFYRGKDRLQDALTQYDKAIEILKKLPKEKDLLKNAELNKSEVKKQIDAKAPE